MTKERRAGNSGFASGIRISNHVLKQTIPRQKRINSSQSVVSTGNVDGKEYAVPTETGINLKKIKNPRKVDARRNRSIFSSSDNGELRVYKLRINKMKIIIKSMK
jgi:hypothetical protein